MRVALNGVRAAWGRLRAWRGLQAGMRAGMSWLGM